MKKQFSKLSKAEQEKVELEYHQMNPAEFDEQMKHAKLHVPETIRLPSQLVATLQKMAESAGETGYQEMVRKWIEERLQQENMAASAR
ncbi:MAG: hypothetical protein ABIP14_08160 [Blastocatellia bacterium]